MGGGTRQVVVVTGASAGVGRAVVREFARHGAQIGLLARGADGLEAASTDVELLGGKALAVPTDVAHAHEVERAAQAVEEAFGPIDVWINNAMATVYSPVKDLTPEEFFRVTEVTYLGGVYGTMAALRRMLPRNRGTIVQVGSALAYRAIPLQSAYCGAKHALHGFSESLRAELAHDRSRVRVHEVHLPAMNTPQFEWGKNHLPRRPQPVGAIYQPEVAARAVHWSAHHNRPEILVGGPTVQAIWGDKLFPHLLDRLLGRVAYEGQLTSVPADPDEPHNLWDPLPGDYGAHGPFDRGARSFSLQLLWTMHRRLITLGAAGVAAAALGLRWAKNA